MTRMEWINLAALIVAIAAGGAYIGHLDGRVEALESAKALDQIREAKERAIDEVEEAIGGFGALGSLHADEFTWTQGDDEVQMIRKVEGICYLVRVTGDFAGGGERVHIFEKGDYWFLGGGSMKAGIAASARCWRFPSFSAESTQ